MKTKSFLIIVVLFCLTMGCAVPMYTYRSAYTNELKVDDIVAASVAALSNSGFMISMANENLGIVSTDWKSLTSAGANALSVILGGGTSHRRMKFNINVNKITKHIICRPAVEYKSGLSGWDNTAMSTKEKKVANKIITEILEMLSLSTDSIEVIVEQ